MNIDASLTLFHDTKIVGLHLYNSLELFDAPSDLADLILVKLGSRSNILFKLVSAYS